MPKFSYKLGGQKQIKPNFTSPNSFRSRFLSFKKSRYVFGLVALTLLLAVSANAAFSSDGRSFFGIFDYSGATITTTNTSGNVTTKSSKPYDFLNLLNWKTKSAPPPVAFFNVSVDFRQSANNDGLGLGSNHWLNSIVQSSNSVYYEGMSNFQRAIFTDVPATTGNNHSLTFEHDATKGGIHAYDFLTSYQQAIVNNQALLGVPVTLNPCGTNIAASMVTPCNTVRGGLNFIDVDVPDDTFLSKDGPTATKIAAYEVINGNRTIRIWGNAPFVPGSAVLTLSHSVATQADSADSNINYILTWQSTSTVILLEMAGHISVTGDGTGVSWGTGLGSSNISGGPYHFKLGDLGGAVTGGVQSEVTALGAQDNQIKGADVKIVCPTCSVSGPATVCASTTSTFSESIVGTCASQSILWSITGNGQITGSNNGTNVAVISGSGAGSYTVTATLTCASCPPVVCNKTVAVTAPITITESHTNVSCFGGTTGAIDLTVSGGTAPYSYSWSNGANTQDLSGLTAGIYTVTVTDSTSNNSCTGTKTVEITQPAAALAANAVPTNILCFGGNGSVNLTVSGGTGPYTYLWSNGATTEDLASVPAGVYSVTVTDANNCTTPASATVTQPAAALAANAVPTNILCFGGNGAVDLTVSGGTGPYTYLWSNGATTEDLASVPAGAYSVTVTDANGCTAPANATVTQPSSFTVTITGPAEVCTGSPATLVAGAGFASYLWSNGATTQSITVSPALTTTYSVTVTNAAGCPATNSFTVTTKDCSQVFCTLTQGAWGNDNGKFNGEVRIDTIKRLITAANPLIIGSNGRTISFVDGAEHCLVDKMPAGGTAAALPAGLGDVLCGGIPPSLLKNGRLNSVIWGQTVALSMNVRLDPNLGGKELCRTMITAKALPGPDGKVGTSDDIPEAPGADLNLDGVPDNYLKVTIPNSVFTALGGNPATVNNILALANLALGGQNTGASLPDINSALDAINRGFDECRFLVSCTN